MSALRDPSGHGAKAPLCHFYGIALLVFAFSAAATRLTGG